MEQVTVYNKKSSKKIKITISIVTFKEDSNYIVYCPSLDLSGYGKTAAEARKSFDIVIAETFSYAHKEDTLSTLLTSLGWFKNRGTHTVYKASNIASKISSNDYLQNVINQSSEVKLNNNVEMVFA